MMHWRTAGLALLLALAPALRAAAPPRPDAALAAALQEARKGNIDVAFLAADALLKQHPQDANIRAVRDVLQQRAVLDHLERAHNLAGLGQTLPAAVEYRSALAIDPTNVDARIGLATELASPAPHRAPDGSLRVADLAPPVQPEPSATPHAFHLEGGLRQVLGTVTAAYGMKAYVANTVPDVHFRLDIADASFAQAMRVIGDLASVNFVALDPHTLYFDTREKMLTELPLAQRTFYLPWLTKPNDLTEMSSMLRNTLDLRQVDVDQSHMALVVRATPEQLDAAERLLLDLSQPPGEIVLELKLLEVSRTVAETLGVNAPTEFQMFSLGPLLEQLEQTQSLQSLISQFFTSGGLNSLLTNGTISSTALQAAASQLSPLLQQPFVTFGGGATLMALTVPGAGVAASDATEQVNTLDDAWLRAADGQAADLKVGQRYPILNTSFSPIYLSSAIAQAIGTGSLVQPFPSFTYEDLGLELKITPHLSAGPGAIPEVALEVESDVTALTGAETNGMPVLSNRNVKTQMSLHDGEPALLAGLFDQSEQQSLSGIPGLNSIPGLGLLFSQESPQLSRDELLILVTPHFVSRPRSDTAAIWLPPGFGTQTPPSGPPPTDIPGLGPPINGVPPPVQPIIPPGPGRGGFGGDSPGRGGN